MEENKTSYLTMVDSLNWQIPSISTFRFLVI